MSDCEAGPIPAGPVTATKKNQAEAGHEEREPTFAGRLPILCFASRRRSGGKERAS